MLKLEIYKFENKKKIILSSPRPSYFNNNIVLIKLIYNNQISSLGEINPYSGNFFEIIKNLKLIFFKIKKYDLKKDDLIKVFRNQINHGNNFCFNSCIAGFSQALIGLVSEFKNKKIFNIFSKKKIPINQKINVYASGGMIYEGQELKLIEEAEFCKQDGYFGYKFRPPYPRKFNNHNLRFNKPDHFNIKKFIKISQKLRDTVGNEFNLMADLGCRLKNTSEFIYIMDALRELNFFFVEEPVIRNLELYKKIRHYENIASGEHLYDFNETNKWISCKNINFFQFDPNSLSVFLIFSLLKKIKSKQKIYIPHNWTTQINTAVGINLLLLFQQKINLIEKNFYMSPFNDLFINKGFYLSKGNYVLVNNKGFGIKFNSKNFNKYNYEIVSFI
jgi:L-alanine-DL-glutamate epimerase-like enolase superfamily enzyme